MRLHFDGYDESSGRIEGRDAAGDQLFSMDIRKLLGSVPCFTANSQIATGQGMIPVSALTPGTRVITRDNGMQELLWVGRRRFGWQALGLNPLLRPVRISAGALGQGLPERDMVVSPNHRFLTRMPGEGEAAERLTMARDLVGLYGIACDAAIEVEYWQLLFARHELVLADGSWSESFLPTQASLAALDSEGRAALSLALPGIETEVITGFDSVRPFAEIGSAA
ncbi:Hint domain-containing protein [Rhodobacter viridis]|nr:Hint domain-containing protein [Rhodobacter viridis]